MRRNILRLSACLIVVAMLLPTVSPAIGQATLVLAKQKPVDVVHTSDAEPAYVADQLDTFAGDADLNFRFQEVDDPGEMLDAIRRSDADLLIVVGHGATNRPGPGSGVVVGDARIAPGSLTAAIADSSADRFYVAVCGLGLPDQIDGREVVSYDRPIDKKVAVADLLVGIAEIYPRSVLADSAPDVRATIERLGGKQELVQRLLVPQEPLRTARRYCHYHNDANGDAMNCHHHVDKWDRWGYQVTPYDSWETFERTCYEQNNCWWGRDIEEDSFDRAHAEGGGFAKAGEFFRKSFKWWLDADAARVKWDTEEWDFLVEVDFGGSLSNGQICRNGITLFQVKDVALPGIARVITRAEDRVKFLNFEVDVFAMDACGSLKVGDPAGESMGDATIAPRFQVGSGVQVELDFGRWSRWLRLSAWAGLVGIPEFDLDRTSWCHYDLKVDLDAGFLLMGKLTIIGAALPKTWDVIDEAFGFDLPGSQCAQESSADAPGSPSGVGAMPRVSATSATDGVAANVERTYVTTTLNKPDLNALKRNETLRRRLSDALGTDAAQLSPGTKLNLADEGVCHAIYGPDATCPDAKEDVGLPQDDATPDAPAKAGAEECAEEEVPSIGPAPRVGARACARTDDGNTLASAEAGATVGGSDVIGTLHDTSNGLTKPSYWTTRVYETCPPDQFDTCRAVTTWVSSVDSPTQERTKRGIAASIAVDIYKNNTVVATQTCADSTVTGETCADYEVDGSYELLDQEDYLDRKFAETIALINPGGIATDYCRWQNGVQGDQDDCGDSSAQIDRAPDAPGWRR